MNNKIIKLDGADWTKSEIQTLIDSIKKGFGNYDVSYDEFKDIEYFDYMLNITLILYNSKKSENDY
jgi:hypothetical protein